MVEEILGIKHIRTHLFDKETVKEIVYNPILKNLINDVRSLPIKSEKSRSEAIVFPVLLELRNINHQKITFYSGDSLNVDAKIGLKGECDFVITQENNSLEIKYPILQIVEAKRSDMEYGIAQCAAQMVGANRFNQKYKHNKNTVYGCSTTGKEWVFLKLQDKQLFVDLQEYYLDDLGKILGVFQVIIDEFKPILD
jgi:hypothetical protein